MSVKAIISQSIEDDSLESITFVFKLSNITFKMIINDGDIRLDDPNIWLNFLEKEVCTQGFGSFYGSHVDNGEISICRNGEMVKFVNDNAQGCVTFVNIPFEECKVAFTYLANIFSL